MKYIFDAFTVDASLGELREGQQNLALEPRAFALLCYLIENRDRIATKDDLVESLWGGRVVSDAAISTVIKNARKALGDDGKTQKYIRTIHGRGFRFVGEVTEETSTPTAQETSIRISAEAEPPRSGNAFPYLTDDPALKGERPAVAVFPFRASGASEGFAAIADAIPGEIIANLSRLRWLKVMARGTTFRFRDREQDFDSIRSSLGVGYTLSGDVELFGSDLAISVALSDTRTEQTVWGDRLTGKIDDVHQIREDIVNLVTSALELHIPLNEVELARLKPPEGLDAWSVYHIGLQHMYRFNQKDNLLAAECFRRATELDPNFSRGFAARSFTSFQSAFLRYGADRGVDIQEARRFAERAVELDPIDPAGNFNLGRSYWLNEDPEAGQAWIERAISLSPSYAQGYYAHAWADVMSNKGGTALDHLQRAISLSPLDPFLYAMQSARGMAYLEENQLEEAAYWADQGARKPGAHYLIYAVAAAMHKIAGHQERADYWARKCLALQPGTSVVQFLGAFPFEDAATRKFYTDALLSLGFSKE